MPRLSFLLVLTTLLLGCSSSPPPRAPAAPPRSAPLRPLPPPSPGAALGAATWVGTFTESPSDLTASPGPVPLGNFLEIELVLVSEDERTSPTVRDVSVQYLCPL